MKAFHYTSGQSLFGILNSQELHCTNLRFMNDPSEEFYFDQLVKELFEKDASELRFVHEALYDKSYQDSVLSPTEKFIVSFSMNGDSLSMWNYYSKGNGYNFEIDLEKVIDLNNTYDLSVIKVNINYDKRNQIELLEQLLFDYKEKALKFTEGKEKLRNVKSEDEYYEILAETYPIEMSYNDDLQKLNITFKHPAYHREEGVRLIVSEAPGEFEGKNVRFRISNSGVFVSYIPIILNPSDCITKITTHPLNGELHRLGIKEFLKSDAKFKHIEAITSKIPFREI